MTAETKTSGTATAVNPEIRLRYEMVDGVMQIDVRSKGLQGDPNLIALHLQLALERLLATAEIPGKTD